MTRALNQFVALNRLNDVPIVFCIVLKTNIYMVTSFGYLGSVISAADDDWLEVVRNLAKPRVVWRRITRILSREGANLWVSDFFLKDVVQSLILFGTA